MKKHPKRKLTREDWIFIKDEECPDDELLFCYQYEMARESLYEGFRERRGHPEVTWQGWDPLLRHFPEWPRKPWLAIKLPVRKRRLAAYLKEQRERVAQRETYLPIEALHPLIGNVEKLRDNEGVYQNQVTYEPSIEPSFSVDCVADLTTYFVHQIVWRMPDEFHVRVFKDWLKAGRKYFAEHRKEPRIKKFGNETTTFEKLKRLGVKRLHEAYGFHTAMKLVMLELDNYKPYDSQVPWGHAVTKAKVDFDAYISETPFYY